MGIIVAHRPEVIVMDAAQTHAWVEQYNWDDGLDPIRALVENAQTEFATALLIYWRLEGPRLVSDPAGVNEGARILRDLVQERLLSGFYLKGKLRLDPAAEMSPTQVYKLQKGGLPTELLQPAWGE